MSTDGKAKLGIETVDELLNELKEIVETGEPSRWGLPVRWELHVRWDQPGRR